MAKLNAQQVADKWANNLGAASAQIKAGVLAVTVSPTEKAANRAQAYIDGVQRAVQSGKWQANLRAVTLQQWQQAMIDKGIPIIASRAMAAKNKFRAFMQAWLQYQDGIAQELFSMPRGTLQQNIARAVHVMNRNHEFNKNLANSNFGP